MPIDRLADLPQTWMVGMAWQPRAWARTRLTSPLVAPPVLTRLVNRDPWDESGPEGPAEQLVHGATYAGVMDALQLILYILHMLAMLAIVVGPFVPGRGHLVQVWAARLQLLIGLGLVGLAEAQDWSLDYVWVAVKLVVALAVVACAEIGNSRSKRGENGKPLAFGAAALAIVNVLVAFLW